MNRLDFILSRARGPTVLDLGAVQHDADNADRDDWVHGHLAAEFDRVIGVDVLTEEVSRLRNQGFDIREADCTAMDLDVEADNVVAGEIIEHVDNPGGLLSRAREHLAPDGRLVLTTPNPWAIVNLRRVRRGDLSVNDGHVAWYGPTVLRQLLARNGFEAVELRTTRRSHRGLMRLAQYLDSDTFGGTTWLCVARPTTDSDT